MIHSQGTLAQIVLIRENYQLIGSILIMILKAESYKSIFFLKILSVSDTWKSLVFNMKTING